MQTIAAQRLLVDSDDIMNQLLEGDGASIVYIVDLEWRMTNNGITAFLTTASMDYDTHQSSIGSKRYAMNEI